MSWFRSTQIQDQSFRILVLGSASVGKSTIVQLLYSYYSGTPFAYPTPTWGLQTTVFQYQQKWIEVLEIGRTKHEKSASIVMDQYDGTVLVFDGTFSTLNDLKQFERWFDRPVIVVCTKRYFVDDWFSKRGIPVVYMTNEQDFDPRVFDSFLKLVCQSQPHHVLLDF
jgi:hypothetical protein